MTVETQEIELKLIRRAAGMEIDLLPLQGLWTEEQYLKLSDQTNQFLEEAEDQGVLRAYLARRRTARSLKEAGLMPWEHGDAPVG